MPEDTLIDKETATSKQQTHRLHFCKSRWNDVKGLKLTTFKTQRNCNELLTLLGKKIIRFSSKAKQCQLLLNFLNENKFIPLFKSSNENPKIALFYIKISFDIKS